MNRTSPRPTTSTCVVHIQRRLPLCSCPALLFLTRPASTSLSATFTPLWPLRAHLPCLSFLFSRANTTHSLEVLPSFTQRQMSRPPKPLYPKIDPSCSSQPAAIFPDPNYTGSSVPIESKPHHSFRTKRKHVLKACERCRVKKSKVDPNATCSIPIILAHNVRVQSSAMATSPAPGVCRITRPAFSGTRRRHRIRSIREGRFFFFFFSCWKARGQSIC